MTTNPKTSKWSPNLNEAFHDAEQQRAVAQAGADQIKNVLDDWFSRVEKCKTREEVIQQLTVQTITGTKLLAQALGTLYVLSFVEEHSVEDMTIHKTKILKDVSNEIDKATAEIGLSIFQPGAKDGQD